jgi:hypothetical protein
VSHASEHAALVAHLIAVREHRPVHVADDLLRLRVLSKGSGCRLSRRLPLRELRLMRLLKLSGNALRFRGKGMSGNKRIDF